MAAPKQRPATPPPPPVEEVNPGFAEPEEIVTVSAIVGVGDDARRVVRVGNFWELSQWQTWPDGKPRIRDLDLAIKLAFAQPRDIRKIIKRYIDSGDLPGIHSRATVARQSTGNGGSREYAVEEYWLTYEEAGFIIAKSETPVANQILKAILHVFFVALQALTPERPAPAPAPGLTADEVRAIVAEGLRAHAASSSPPPRASNDTGVIGRERAKMYVLGPLVAYARDKADLEGDLRRAGRWRQKADNRLRRACAFPRGPGQRWENLPEGKLGDAHAELALLNAENEEVRRDRRVDLKKAKREAQLKLFKDAVKGGGSDPN